MPSERTTSLERLQRAGRAAWHELGDAVDWLSNGGRRRKRPTEHGYLYDPAAGYAPPDPSEDELLAERGRYVEEEGKEN